MTVSTSNLEKLGLQQTATVTAQTISTGSAGGFDKLLENISARDNQLQVKNNVANKAERTSKNTPRQDNKPKTADKKVAKTVEQSKEALETMQTQETKPAETVEEADSLQNTEGSKPVNTDVLKENIVAKVAEALDIPQELLSQILAALNLQPEDLLDKSNLTLVVMELVGAEEPVELLTVPGVNDMLESMAQAVEEAVVLAENNVLVQLEAEKKEAATVKQETGTAVKTEMTQTISEDQNVDNFFDLVAVSSDESNSGNNNSDEAGTQRDSAGNRSEIEAPIMESAEQSIQADVEFEGNVFFNDIDLETSTLTSHLARNEALRSVNPQEVLSQIVDKIKVDVKTDMSEIKLNLRPEHLGDVSLKVTTENGIITAQFIAESQRVKEIIEANFNRLEDALKEQGINVNELSVSVQQDDAERQMQEFLQGQTKSAARINKIINGIAEEEQAEQMVDTAKVYKNTVNYEI